MTVSVTNGFRCVRYLEPLEEAEEAFRPVELLIRDYGEKKPVSGSIFKVYKQQFLYDPTGLQSRVEARNEGSEHWVEEQVSFNAAYGSERVLAYLYLPKGARTPYQTVILLPGSCAILRRFPNTGRYEFIMKSGRALVWPIYKGTFERRDGLALTWPNETYRYADYVIRWIKDLRRSIDYLETRSDIDLDRLAYFGFSWGARMGAIIPAVEDRLKVSILYSGGLAAGRGRPEVDQINFISRVTIPVLMLNGSYDAIEPLETAQLPMFRLWGTPEADKRHVVYETGHDLPTNRSIKETLDWLDHYLGPVR